MVVKHIIFSLLFIFLARTNAFSQQGLHFINANQKRMKIKFEMVNNLIVIPLTLNGVQLSFLLDTGVEQTLLFVNDASEAERFQKTKKVNVRGLGEEDQFEAYQSLGNTLQIQEAINTDQEIIFFVDENFTLTSRLGLPINGIIGYDFFSNFVVRINYSSSTITLFNPKYFSKKLRRYEQKTLRFHRSKPYINLAVQDTTFQRDNLNFLLDTGSGSSFWLIESDFVHVPNVFFDDVLGYGIRSPILGKRSRVKQISFGKYKFENINVAYPDVEQIYQIEQNVLRHGTVGSEILKRFKLYLDYPNKRIFFKANSNIRNSFNYDMSGLNLAYDGLTLVKEFKSIPMMLKSTQSTKSEYESNFTNQSTVNIMIKPKLVVDAVRAFSPAAEVGIQPGDELIKINRSMVYNLKLSTIQSILSEEEGKTVKLKIKRDQKIISKNIELRDRLQDLLNNAKK